MRGHQILNIQHSLAHGESIEAPEMPSATTNISSQSRKKLKAFELTPQPVVDLTKPYHDHVEKRQNGSQKSLSSAQNDTGEALQLPPNTPPKISFSDLVANPDENATQLPSCTPGDQVTWTHVGGLMATPSSSARTTQSRRKRAHSSSPRTSQDPRAARLNMKSLSQSLQKAPPVHSPGQDDPAAILWKAYADKKEGEPPLPALPVLNLSQKAGIKDFRRTASCGIEWPTSSSKRRKVKHHDPHGTTKQIFASKRKELLHADISRQSRVSLLLDNIQQSFIARQRDQDVPSSSSPLPVTLHVVPDQVSPAEELPPVLSPVRRPQLPVSPTRSVRSPLKNVEKTSDYGDMDLDDEDIQNIEQALTQDAAQEFSHIHSKLPPALRHADTAHPACIGDSATEWMKRPSSSRKRSQSPTSKGRPVSKKGFEVFVDEFSDDCLDVDLEELMAKVESQKATSSAAKIIPPGPPIQQLKQDSTLR